MVLESPGVLPPSIPSLAAPFPPSFLPPSPLDSLFFLLLLSLSLQDPQDVGRSEGGKVTTF